MHDDNDALNVDEEAEQEHNRRNPKRQCVRSNAFVNREDDDLYAYDDVDQMGFFPYEEEDLMHNGIDC